jgi:hypothetical protein
MSNILNVKIDNDLKEKLEILCKKERRNKSNMLNYLIDYYYNNQFESKKEVKKEIGEYKKPPDEFYEKLSNMRGKIHLDDHLGESRT